MEETVSNAQKQSNHRMRFIITNMLGRWNSHSQHDFDMKRSRLGIHVFALPTRECLARSSRECRTNVVDNGTEVVHVTNVVSLWRVSPRPQEGLSTFKDSP